MLFQAFPERSPCRHSLRIHARNLSSVSDHLCPHFVCVAVASVVFFVIASVVCFVAASVVCLHRLRGLLGQLDVELPFLCDESVSTWHTHFRGRAVLT